MNAFIIELRNEPGSLAKLAEAIAQRGINITAFGGVTAGATGSVALVTNDEEGTRRALSEGGMMAREVELVTASLENKPGALAATTRKLADAGINIEAALPIGMSEGKVSVAFATDKPAMARELIGSAQPAGIGVG